MAHDDAARAIRVPPKVALDDGNGNETGRCSGLTAFAYNGKDQTTSITNNGASLAMTYTGDSQVARLAAGTSTFGSTLLGLSSETEGRSTTYYVRDNAGRLVGERIGSVMYYYLFDGLGSVVALTDGTGVVKNTYSYDPHGQVTAGSNPIPNPWQYTGGYRDTVTGLVNLGQRFYDPSLGRWTQRDPVGDGNSYVYTDDNPVNFVDPSGLFRFDQFVMDVQNNVKAALPVAIIAGAIAGAGAGSPLGPEGTIAGAVGGGQAGAGAAVLYGVGKAIADNILYPALGLG